MLQKVAQSARIVVILLACIAMQPSALAQGEAGGESPANSAAAAPTGATDGDPAATTEATPGNFFSSFFSNPINLILLSAILFMFIVVRPQQRQYKELQKALSDVKKNTRIVTSGGIHGTVVQTNENNTVVIRIDDASGAKLTINRDAIAKVVVPEENKNKKA